MICVGDRSVWERHWLELIGKMGDLLRHAPLQWNEKGVVPWTRKDCFTDGVKCNSISEMQLQRHPFVQVLFELSCS